MKNPNSCSIHIYMRHTNLNLYLATTKVFYSFVLNNKVTYPIIFLFFFLTFSSHSLTLLHIIYQLVLGNKYCKFHLSCWYQLYSFPIYQLLKNGVRKNKFKCVPTESRNHSEDFVYSWSHCSVCLHISETSYGIALKKSEL